MITVNMSKLVREMVSIPSLKGVPLYTRVETAEEDEYIKNKSGEWVAKSKKLFSSPDNIRRVMITCRGVYVYLYQPIYGASSKGLRREYKYKIDIAEVRRSVEAKDGNYKVIKNGLTGIVFPWVLSNVEEIYWDWTLLLSSDINNMGLGNLLDMYTHKCGKGNMYLDITKEMFNRACGNGVNNLRARFPRLKAYGYIGNLASIMENYTDSETDYLAEDKYDKLCKLWSVNKYVENELRSENSVVSICTLGKANVYNKNRSVKPNIYLYDKIVLNEYFNKIDEKADRLYKLRNKECEEIDDKKDKCSLEKLLDSTYEEYGKEKAIKILKMSLYGMSAKEKQKVIMDMSKQGVERYGSILKGKN